MTVFGQLQKDRHRADYDLGWNIVGTDVTDAITLAEDTFYKWRAIRERGGGATSQFGSLPARRHFSHADFRLPSRLSRSTSLLSDFQRLPQAVKKGTHFSQYTGFIRQEYVMRTP